MEKALMETEKSTPGDFLSRAPSGPSSSRGFFTQRGCSEDGEDFPSLEASPIKPRELATIHDTRSTLVEVNSAEEIDTIQRGIEVNNATIVNMISTSWKNGTIYRATRASAILFLVTFLLGGTSGQYDSGGKENFASRSLDGNANGLCTGANCADRVAPGVSGAMWFGPRLGRRRRSDEKSDDATSFDDDRIDAIMADVLRVAPWTLVSIQGTDAKRHANQFTPRLGRESGEELLQQLLADEERTRFPHPIIDDPNNDILEERQLSVPPPPPPFAPRLGRRLLPLFAPSPRLGRRLRALFRNQKV